MAWVEAPQARRHAERPAAGVGGSSTARGTERPQMSVEERKTAFFLGGHTWNPINHEAEHYLRSARNREHFTDEHGRSTRHWMQQRGRHDVDGDGTCDILESSGIHEALRCPATAGKDSARARTRQLRQICQAGAPTDYGAYTARRRGVDAPPTPARADALARTAPPEAAARLTPRRPVHRAEWTPRRGEPRAEARAPPAEEAYRRVDQLRAESHFDVTDPAFAASLKSARGAPSLAAAGCAASTFRSMLGAEGARTTGGQFHSTKRVEALNSREISMDVRSEQDKLKRGDAYHTRPVQQSGSSSVKYDVITNERKQYWY